jgi:hypothetical protein
MVPENYWELVAFENPENGRALQEAKFVSFV